MSEPFQGRPATDRRAFPRRVLRTDAILIRAAESIPVRTWDISGDGISLIAPKPVTPGRRCELTITLPLRDGEQTITVALKIVFSSYLGPANFKIGGVFATLGDEAAAAIARYAGPQGPPPARDRGD